MPLVVVVSRLGLLVPQPVRLDWPGAQASVVSAPHGASTTDSKAYLAVAAVEGGWGMKVLVHHRLFNR